MADPAAATARSEADGPAKRPMHLRVTAAAEQLLRHGHPWLYDRAIRDQNRAGTPGELAVIFDRHREFLAVGLYDPTSPIRVRILQHRKPAAIDRAWFRQRLETAMARRRSLMRHPGITGFRLVHGENDGLPGLVVDRYDQTLVLQLHSLAWIPHLPELLAALLPLAKPQRVLLRLARSLQEHHRLLAGHTDGELLAGRPLEGPVLFLEHGLRFAVDPVHGQKTGFFLDQRDNRAKVRELAGKARVLDLFAYTGGFSVYAAAGGAREVLTVDGSQPALDAARQNMALNHRAPGVRRVAHRLERADGFEVLGSLAQQAERFDLVVLDPPSFAKSEADVPAAVSAYRRLTRLGLGVLKRRGVLVIACCSSHVGAPLFYKTVLETASRMRRPLHELGRAGHPLDHPISHREGEYLKCLFARA